MKLNIFITSCLLIGSFHSFSQDSISVKTNFEIDSVFFKVDKSAEYIGGISKLYRFIGENLRYPMLAEFAKLKGYVYARFIIEKDGSISNPTILKGIGYGCDEEAVRVLNMLPKWNPGEINGQKVRQYYVLPFKFHKDM